MFNKSTILMSVIGVGLSVLVIAGVSKVVYEHNHIQQNEITVNNQTIENVLNKEIMSHNKINGQIVSSNFVCVARGSRILPMKYTITYNQNGTNNNYTLPNPDMIKKVSIDGLIQNDVLPYNNTIVNGTYHITPIADSKCNVAYDIKWQNTTYDKNKWFYWIW